MITLFRGPPPLEEGGVPQIQPVVAAPAKYIGGMALVDEVRSARRWNHRFAIASFVIGDKGTPHADKTNFDCECLLGRT